MSGKRYLVTGGAGFIGHHIVRRLLSEGHSVRVLDDMSTGQRENVPGKVELVEGDIVDKNVVAKAMRGVDGCFHMAAISSVERARQFGERSHDVNYNGTAHVMDAALKQKAPVVYASSAAVYGAVDTLPITEKVHPVPINQYGEDKWKGEVYAYGLEKDQGYHTASIRIFNCYGPGQRADSIDSGVIARFCDLAMQKRPITVYGNGKQTRDFVYVDDVVDIFVSAMQRLHVTPQSLVVNACTGVQTSLLQLIDTLSEVLQHTIEVKHEAARPDAIVDSLGSPELARAMLGWRARTSLSDGLKQLFLCKMF